MTRRVPCTGLRGSVLTGLVSALMLVGGTAIAAPGDPGLGTAGTSVAVDALERTEDGLLRVTATVTNHGQDTFPSSRLREFSMPNSTLGLFVVDPATGAVSRPDDVQQGRHRDGDQADGGADEQ